MTKKIHLSGSDIVNEANVLKTKITGTHCNLPAWIYIAENRFTSSEAVHLNIRIQFYIIFKPMNLKIILHPRTVVR